MLHFTPRASSFSSKRLKNLEWRQASTALQFKSWNISWCWQCCIPDKKYRKQRENPYLYSEKEEGKKKKKKGATVNITEHKLLERQVHVKEGIASRDKTVLFYQLQVSLQLLQFQGTVHSKKKDTYICIFFPGKSWIYRSPSQDSEQELRGSLPKPKEILRIYH